MHEAHVHEAQMQGTVYLSCILIKVLKAPHCTGNKSVYKALKYLSTAKEIAAKVSAA